MNIVSVKSKYQIVIPAKVRKAAGIEVGDFLEAGFEKGRITLIPQTVLDRELAESLEDFRQGRSYGPFNTHGEMMRSLKLNIKRLRAQKKHKNR